MANLASFNNFDRFSYHKSSSFSILMAGFRNWRESSRGGYGSFVGCVRPILPPASRFAVIVNFLTYQCYRSLRHHRYNNL